MLDITYLSSSNFLWIFPSFYPVSFFAKTLYSVQFEGHKFHLHQQHRSWINMYVFSFPPGESDSDDDDFLTSSKHNQPVDSKDEVEEKVDTAYPSQETVENEPGTKKLITKYAMVKKLVRQNIQLNTRVVFDDEGKQVLDPTKHQVSQKLSQHIVTVSMYSLV